MAPGLGVTLGRIQPVTTSTSTVKPAVVGEEGAGSRRKQLIALGLLIGWTLLVWVGRVRNVLAGDDLAGFAKTWRLGVALGFVAAGFVLAALVVGKVRGRGQSGPTSLARPSAVGSFASLLAIVGIAWWLIRGGGILLGDFDTSFKIVHSVLAVVTFGLSGLVLMATRSTAKER